MLGYDPTLRLIEANVAEPYNSIWEIDMPRGEDPAERDTFVLFRALSLTAGETICGRAARVWLAHQKDSDPKTREVQHSETMPTSALSSSRLLICFTLVDIYIEGHMEPGRSSA